MRQQGRVTEWNDNRGFGFVTPRGGGDRVFLHISEFPRGERRPMELDLVTYAVGQDDRGRRRAVQVLFLTSKRPPLTARPQTGRSSTLPITLAISALLLALAAACALFVSFGPVTATHTVSSPATSSDSEIAGAFSLQRSGVQVTGEGVVTRVLSDDNDGSRHQRFILRLSSGQTLLVAHNIDLAPRVTSLEPGDSVAFSGVYEWNSEGGVIHWTHHDPNGQHQIGWLRHNGVTYQ